MTTKEQLENTYTEYCEAKEALFDKLERIWRISRELKNDKLSSAVEDAQIGYDGLSACGSKMTMLYMEMLDVAKVNESIESLPNLVDALDAIARIKGCVDRFYEIRKKPED